MEAALQCEIQKHLKPAQILRVTGKDADDQYGKPILKIMAIFKSEDDWLDPEKTVSLIRHLRNPLKSELKDRFPVPAFRYPEEAQKRPLIWPPMEFLTSLPVQRNAEDTDTVRHQEISEHCVLRDILRALRELC